MGISNVRSEADQALELLQAVPRFRPWAPNYYMPSTRPSTTPLSDWSLRDIGSALRGEPNRLTGERFSTVPREALVSELTRRAGQMPSTSQPWTAPEDYAPQPVPGALATVPATEGELPLPPPDAPPRISPAGNPPAQARARSGTSVVTPSAGSGVAVPQTPAPTMSPEQMAPPISLAPQSQRQSPLQAEPGQRLMEFGLAMLASRSPYFGQAVGEAGQAVIASDRTRRQENREQQKADTDQQYREGILRLEAAQQAWRQDRRNPEAIMQLARAQAYLASIETDRTRANAAATAAGETVRDGIVPNTMFEDAEGNAAFMTRNGSVRSTGQPFESFGQQSRFSREQAAWDQRMGQERRAIRTAILGGIRGPTMTPEQVEAAVEASMRQVMVADPRPGRRSTPAEGPQRIRLPD